jgi:hypothetical protein
LTPKYGIIGGPKAAVGDPGAHSASHSSPPLSTESPTGRNSTTGLRVRIEELNAQISALRVENLRLWASGIGLGLQLKKEREKSQRIMTAAESAVRFHRFYSPMFFTPIALFLRTGAIVIPFHYWLSISQR